GRYDKGRLLAALAVAREARMGVVSALWQEPADVDAVGGAEAVPRVEVRVRHGLLHQRLAVVEASVHRQGENVVAPAGKLPRLSLRDPAFRKQDNNAHSRPLIEGGGDGAAGIAGCSHQDGQGNRLVPLQAAQAGCKEACTDVLEGRG